MKYFVVLFVAVIVIGFAAAGDPRVEQSAPLQGSAPVSTAPRKVPTGPLPDVLKLISNVVVNLKVFLDTLVPTISKAVNYILAVAISGLLNLLTLVVAPNTPVPVAPVAAALKPLNNPSLDAVLKLLTKLLSSDADFILYFMPTSIAVTPIAVPVLLKALLAAAAGAAQVPLSAVVKVVGDYVINYHSLKLL